MENDDALHLNCQGRPSQAESDRHDPPGGNAFWLQSGHLIREAQRAVRRFFSDPVLANASKPHEGREMAEPTRLMIDVAGGFVAELHSDRDLENENTEPLIKKYLKGASDISTEKRVKLYWLIGKMAMENAHTISDIHGGGSPEAHRITIFRESNIDAKKKAAKRLPGIDD